MSMAVSTTGEVYGWGKTDGGRIGLGLENVHVVLPRRVGLPKQFSEAVDVECGYVHSIVVGLDGSLLTCGNVGVEGESDGLQIENTGVATVLDDFNVWHRIPEPSVVPVKKERSKKYGKYEVKGRSKMLETE